MPHVSEQADTKHGLTSESCPSHSPARATQVRMRTVLPTPHVVLQAPHSFHPEKPVQEKDLLFTMTTFQCRHCI